MMSILKSRIQKPLGWLVALGGVFILGNLSHGFFGPNNSAKTQVCVNLDERGLKKMIADTGEAFSSGVAARFVSQFTADTLVIGSGGKQWITNDSQMMPAIYDLMKHKPKFDFTPKKMWIGCKGAWNAGTIQIQLQSTQYAQTDPENFRYTMIYRFENGVWKIAHMHISAPQKVDAK